MLRSFFFQRVNGGFLLALFTLFLGRVLITFFFLSKTKN